MLEKSSTVLRGSDTNHIHPCCWGEFWYFTYKPHRPFWKVVPKLEYLRLRDGILIITFMKISYLILNTTMPNKKTSTWHSPCILVQTKLLTNCFGQLCHVFMCLDLAHYSSHPSKTNIGYPQPPASRQNIYPSPTLIVYITKKTWSFLCRSRICKWLEFPNLKSCGHHLGWIPWSQTTM